MSTIYKIIIFLIIVLGWFFFGDQFIGTTKTDEDILMKTMEDNNATTTIKIDEEQAIEKERADVTIELTGRNFAFSKTEIKVKEGDTVTVNFESADGFHDFVIDEFNAKTGKVNNGEKTTVTFVANKKGSYEYYCSVGDHRVKGMVGAIIVE